MLCADCYLDPCVCEQRPSTVRDTFHVIPADAMTKEEFGLDLFEAIVCCGSILQLQQLREKTPPNRIKKHQLLEWQQKERAQIERLKEIAKVLPDGNVADLMRRYPFIASI